MKNNYIVKADIKSQITEKVLKKHIYSVSKEIEQQFSIDPEINVKIKNEGSDLYTLSMNVFGSDEIYYAKKTGRKVIPLIKKVRRTILKNIRKNKKLKINQNKKKRLKYLKVS